jgi:hypothetical protein
MVIRRIDPFSLAKIFGLLYAGLGLLIGAVVTLVALVGSGLAAAGEESPIPLFGLFFGVGAIVLLPILYGFFGFVGGLVWSGLYNLAARWTGGVVLETDAR